MKLIKQLLIILSISLIGELLSFLIPLPIPSSIYGIVIMLASLITGVLKLEQIRDVSSFLIEIMPIMFIPATVGLMQSYHLLASSLGAYVIIILISTVTVMVISGRVTQRVIQLKKKKEDISNA